MAKGAHQKLKMLYLVDILMKETDENNGITLQEITTLLNDYGVNADRKTLYLDLKELREYGLEISIEQKNRTFYYRLLSREFQLAELKLLVESVQAAKFITAKKSHELITKLETLVSKHDANQLNRQLFIPGRIKSMNESIYYSVDLLHNAINKNRQIRFLYYQWNINKKLVPRHNGSPYQISPLSLVLDNENYYLIGYDAQEEKIKHFRVDKMKQINILDKKRDGTKRLSQKELSQYTSHVFNMYSGQKMYVTIEAPNSMIGVFIDRFGKDVFIVPTEGKDSFRLSIDVEISPQFLGWLVGLGPTVKLLSPLEAINRLRNLITQLSKQYL